jgi:hypothetical protein
LAPLAKELVELVELEVAQIKMVHPVHPVTTARRVLLVMRDLAAHSAMQVLHHQQIGQED